MCARFCVEQLQSGFSFTSQSQNGLTATRSATGFQKDRSRNLLLNPVQFQRINKPSSRTGPWPRSETLGPGEATAAAVAACLKMLLSTVQDELLLPAASACNENPSITGFIRVWLFTQDFFCFSSKHCGNPACRQTTHVTALKRHLTCTLWGETLSFISTVMDEPLNETFH